MSDFYLGAYWQSRKITLREYVSLTTSYLKILMQHHSSFRNFETSYGHADRAIKIADDLSNASEILKNVAISDEVLYSHLDANSQPTWESDSPLGFTTSFQNGKPPQKGGVGLIISAGIESKRLSNAVTVKFPAVNTNSDLQSDLMVYARLKQLILDSINLWRPDVARVASHNFSDKIANGNFTDIGWFTYIQNPNASAMRNNPDLIAAGIEMEPVSIGGSLFTIDREMVSPDNEIQVARARLLRSKLMEYGLIES
jgi:Immunity protein 52